MHSKYYWLQQTTCVQLQLGTGRVHVHWSIPDNNWGRASIVYSPYFVGVSIATVATLPFWRSASIHVRYMYAHALLPGIWILIAISICLVDHGLDTNLKWSLQDWRRIHTLWKNHFGLSCRDGLHPQASPLWHPSEELKVSVAISYVYSNEYLHKGW